MESDSEMVHFPQLPTPIESSYRACTIPYRFPCDDPNKATPTELSWINVLANSIISFKKRAESDTTVPDTTARAEIFAERYAGILENLKKDPESHGGPLDGVVKSKYLDEENAKAISLFPEVVSLSDAIEDDGKQLENLVRGIFAVNIFDLGSAHVSPFLYNIGFFSRLSLVSLPQEACPNLQALHHY